MKQTQTKQHNRVAELNEQLKNQLLEIENDPAKLIELLALHFRFPRYSKRNIILLLLQKPNATQTKTFLQWKALGRGCKPKTGIILFQPCFKRTQTKEELENGEMTSFTGRYKPFTVFDISDTYPLNGQEEQIEENKNHQALFSALWDITSKELPVSFGHTKNAEGYYHLINHEIVLKEANQDNIPMSFSVLVHEFAHSRLHKLTGEFEHVGHKVREAQAETVSYIVSSYFGLETTKQSLLYVHFHLNGTGYLKTVGEECQELAKEIIQSLETALTQAATVH